MITSAPQSASSSLNEISVGDREYYRAQTRREAYNQILERFTNLSMDHVALRSLIADRLGKNRAQVTRWLSEPSNLTLDTLSDLLLAMDSEIKMTHCVLGSEAKGNYAHPNSTAPKPEFINRAVKAVTSSSGHTIPISLGQINNLHTQTASAMPSGALQTELELNNIE